MSEPDPRTYQLLILATPLRSEVEALPRLSRVFFFESNQDKGGERQPHLHVQ